ncbi:hypothetical protein ACEWPM_015710 [Roseovarius sp. S4756]|uniref:hypothetical protein n=1 Tax=Roseovarius maritimus TaxID=3342637 RepID=UPI0037266598
MAVKTYRQVDSMGELLNRMPVEDRRDFFCRLSDDGIADVGVKNLRVQRLPDCLKSMHDDMGSEEKADAYLFTDHVLNKTYLGTVSGSVGMPVRASKEDVEAIHEAYWGYRCDALEKSLSEHIGQDKFEVEDPITGATWKAWNLRMCDVIPDGVGELHVAHCEETGDKLTFDPGDDGSVRIVIRPGDDDELVYGFLAELK